MILWVNFDINYKILYKDVILNFSRAVRGKNFFNFSDKSIHLCDSFEEWAAFK
jgi:hypothetical protein